MLSLPLTNLAILSIKSKVSFCHLSVVKVAMAFNLHGIGFLFGSLTVVDDKTGKTVKTAKIIRPALEWVEDHLHLPVFPRDRILSAVSADGRHWERVPGVAVDVKGRHGSEMVYWPHLATVNGTRRLYFMGSQRLDGRWRERILSAVCEPGQGRWRVEPGERISPAGGHEGSSVFAPWIAELADGIRMYYSGKSEEGESTVLSALSADGISWQRESGIRLSALENKWESVSAPSIIRRDGAWLMFCTCRTDCWTGIGVARSGDGLNWAWVTRSAAAAINPGPRLCAGNPSVVQLDNGGLRMFYTGNDGSAYTSKIYSADSTDGFNWDNPRECIDHSGPFEKHGINFCHVVREEPEKWSMFYTGFWGRHLLGAVTLIQYKQQAKARRAAVERFYADRDK